MKFVELVGSLIAVAVCIGIIAMVLFALYLAKVTVLGAIGILCGVALATGVAFKIQKG